MFAKRSKSSSSQQRPPGGGSQTTQSGPDPRDVEIERLKKELEELRQNGTALRESLDAATFKIEILEKSYAKQLADVRDKLAAKTQQLDDKLQVLSALDGGHEEALRALNDVRAELKLMTAERDQLRKQIAQGGFRQRSETSSRAPAASSVDDTSGGTINELIANVSWAEKKSATIGAGHASAQVTEQDTPHADMLAPELVFTGKDKEDEDEPAR
jgi:chromosome segregation ATPase